jgi:hypothetical protein
MPLLQPATWVSTKPFIASAFDPFGRMAEKSLRIGASNDLIVSLPRMVLSLATVSLSSLGPSAALSTSFMSIFGEIVNYCGETYLMNVMCDLTGFVIVNATNNITAHSVKASKVGIPVSPEGDRFHRRESLFRSEFHHQSQPTSLPC